MIVKVCGLREADNIRAVEAAGADWTGFIFYSDSPRYVKDVPDYLPRHAHRVGVFVSPRYGDVTGQAQRFGLEAVQLHGTAAPELCRKLREHGLKVIRALPADEHLADATHAYVGCVDYFLFDTPTAAHGGSGKQFDWSLLNAYTGRVPFLISGGIGPEALPALCRLHHRAWAGIDLNSRFETAPGRKDDKTLTQFIKAFRKL